MIRVNNQYLDLLPDTRVIIDKQAKLFKDLEATQRDFSYNFEFPATTKNLSILGFPFADNADKTIYTNIPCDIVGEDGVPIYSGKLRVEQMNKRRIVASFFSGNYNWLSLIDGNLTDLNLSEYDTALTSTTIINNRTNTEGVVFPLVDLGGLTTRGQQWLLSEDFTGALYVKTIFRKIFYSEGIKFDGDLTNDFLFNNIVVCTNNRNKEKIEASSCYIEKSTTTNRPTENVDYLMTWQNDSTGRFFDGDNDAFDLANDKYVSPYKQTVELECTLEGSLQDANYSNRIRIYINGVYTFVDIGLSVGGGLYNTAVPGDQQFFSIKRTITLEAGDEVEIYSHWQESTGSTTPVNIVSGELRITPVFIYHVFGSSMVPSWTKKDFVLSVLNLFNVISDFDPISKTVTFNLFEKLKTKESIDISAYVDPSTIELDFVEVIQSYGKKNLLSYTEGDDEDLRIFNIKESVKYGAGSIAVNNDFLDKEVPLLSSGFTAPISYINTVLNCSLERLNLISLEETDTTDFTATTSGGTFARFTITDEFFQVDDLVRVSDSTNPDLNGDWVVYAVGSGFVELSGTTFTETATGTLSKIIHKYTGNNNVFLLVHIPDYDIINFSDVSVFNLDSVSPTALSFCYFNLLDTSDTVNDSFHQGLSFGSVDSMKHYQKSLIDTYWRTVDRILNDPVRIKAEFKFPNSVFRSLTPTKPVYLKTAMTTNQYYINRIRGYRNSHLPCEVELIKL